MYEPRAQDIHAPKMRRSVHVGSCRVSTESRTIRQDADLSKDERNGILKPFDLTAKVLPCGLIICTVIDLQGLRFTALPAKVVPGGQLVLPFLALKPSCCC